MTDPRRFDLGPDFKFIFLLKKIGAHYKKINLIVHLSFAFNRLISWGPPWLNGFVCVSHPAAPGSDSKHIIYSVSVLNGFVKLMLLSAFEF